jgi:hypothetical protein
MEIKRLFETGRVGAGSSGTWRGQKWRIDGSFLVMSERAWKLVPAPPQKCQGRPAASDRRHGQAMHQLVYDARRHGRHEVGAATSIPQPATMDQEEAEGLATAEDHREIERADRLSMGRGARTLHPEEAQASEIDHVSAPKETSRDYAEGPARVERAGRPG